MRAPYNLAILRFSVSILYAILYMEENSNTVFLLNLPFTMVTYVDTD